MNTYEARAATAEQLRVNIIELPLQCEGYCCDNYIFIKQDLTTKEKNCILAEEIAHYLYSAGDIIDQKDLSNEKQNYLPGARLMKAQCLSRMLSRYSVLESRYMI